MRERRGQWEIVLLMGWGQRRKGQTDRQMGGWTEGVRFFDVAGSHLESLFPQAMRTQAPEGRGEDFLGKGGGEGCAIPPTALLGFLSSGLLWS